MNATRMFLNTAEINKYNTAELHVNTVNLNTIASTKCPVPYVLSFVLWGNIHVSKGDKSEDHGWMRA